VTNQILDDLVAALAPQWLRVEGDFLIRGGIRTLVAAEHGKKA
jgi:7-cyano-7-deazaguanine reductase